MKQCTFYRFVKTFPCVAVYMSSLTNMAIAVDRYQVIVRTQSLQVSSCGAFLMLPAILVTSALLAFPLVYKTKLLSINEFLVTKYTIPDVYEDPLRNILLCIEDWSEGGFTGTMTTMDRLWYTIFGSIFQFIIPLLIIIVIYIKIYYFIQRSNKRNCNKMKKTNIILFIKAATFCASWLPFSVFCIISESVNIFQSSESMMLCFTVCHLIGVSSCCTNPILYGFLNPNLCKVFQNFYEESQRYSVGNYNSTTRRTPIHRENLLMKLNQTKNNSSMETDEAITRV